MEPVVTANALTKHFKSVTALTNFNCRINKGEVVGLLGPNGSGKSTLVRLLMGFLNPTSGRAQILGSDCSTERVNVHNHVAYLPGDARMFRTMRGKDVLNFFNAIRGGASTQRATTIAKRLDLDLTRWVAFMSTGMRQKLALSVVLALDSPILILDEPTANLDPTVRNEVLNIVSQAKREERTVIFSSHVLSEIEEVCDRVLILREGKLVHKQCLSELNRQHQIRARSKNQVPAVPDNLRERTTLTIVRDSTTNVDGAQLTTTVDNSDDLSLVLNWLSTGSWESIQMQPVDLRSVYDRYHPARS